MSLVNFSWDNDLDNKVIDLSTRYLQKNIIMKVKNLNNKADLEFFNAVIDLVTLKTNNKGVNPAFVGNNWIKRSSEFFLIYQRWKK